MTRSKVIDNADANKMGRVKIEDGRWIYPISSPSSPSSMEGGASGFFWIPRIGDEVLVYQDYYLGIPNAIY